MVGGCSELRKGLDLGAPLASVGNFLNTLYDPLLRQRSSCHSRQKRK